MKILMISTDRNIFEENSEVRQRMIEYGCLVRELHIIVFTRRKFQIPSNKLQTNSKFQISNNTFVYPTSSRNKLFYIFDAIKIGRKVIENCLPATLSPRPTCQTAVATGGLARRAGKLEIENSSDKFIVTCQDPFETGFVGWRLAKKFNLPLQLQVHTDFLSPYSVQHSVLHRIRTMMAKFLIKRASCVRVVSERIKASLLQATSYKLQAKTIVLPIFVDIEKIKNAPIKTDLRKKYSQFDFIILMASRFTKEKNIPLAINAVSEVVKQYPKTGLIIVGDGLEHEALKLQITNYKLQKNIVLESWTNDLSSYYKTTNLFLLTSNYEGYGRTLIEAASVGCKMISSDVGIADEILLKENIFEPGNKEQLKEKIIKAIKGKLKVSNTECLTKLLTKEQYLSDYKKSWQSCGFAE